MHKTKTVMAIVISFLFVCSGGCSNDKLDGLHPKIHGYYSDRFFGHTCQQPSFCGDMVSINCGAAADGPYTYFNNITGEVIMECGGACMLIDADDPKDCKACPPREWRCDTGY